MVKLNFLYQFAHQRRLHHKLGFVVVAGIFKRLDLKTKQIINNLTDRINQN
jgi:hypothetical protein